MEAHGDSLMPQPGSHRRNACGPRARPRWGHVAPTGWTQCRCQGSRRSYAAPAVLCPNRIQRALRVLQACNRTAESCGFISPVPLGPSPLYPIWTLGPPQGLFRPPRAAASRCATPPQPVPGTRRLSPGWRGRQQAPPAVRPGTFRAAGCGPHRAGAFDAAGDRSPVPARVRCPRLEGKVPGRAGCPRQRPGQGATLTSDSPHVPVGPGAKGTTSRPPAGLGC